MKALILAAGQGLRMGSLTSEICKPQVLLGDTPLISYAIKKLKACGILDINIVIGYKGDRLSRYLVAEFPEINFTFINNFEYTSKNNIYSLYLGLQDIGDFSSLLLLESDVVFNDALISKLVTAPKDNVAVLSDFNENMDGTVVSISGEYISDFYLKSDQLKDFDYKNKFKTVNIYKFSKEFCTQHLIPGLIKQLEIDATCYYELVLRDIVAQNKNIISFINIAPKDYQEIDTLQDLKLAEVKFV